MKLQRSAQIENGSILLAGLITTAVIGVTICSYLLLVQSQHAAVLRSQSWNGALTLAEAGVEEAMAHLNSRLGKMDAPLPDDGWRKLPSGSYSLPLRQVNSGSYQVLYFPGSAPVIISTGSVSIADSSAVISRTLQAATRPAPMFNAAVAVLNGIDVRTHAGLTTDSFDSGDPSHSAHGLYSASSATSNGTVASLSGSVSLNGSVVKGNLLLGPSASYSANQAGSASGSVSRSLSLDLPDIDIDAITWTPGVVHGHGPKGGEDGGDQAGYTFKSNGNYEITTLSGDIFVGANSFVRLKVTGSADPGTIHIASNGTRSGKLEIYMTGSTFTWTGPIEIENGNAKQLAYFGLAGNSLLDFTHISSFTGTVFAPHAQLKMGRSHSQRFSFTGSCIGASLTTRGGCDFHFDQNLPRSGYTLGWTIAQWQEL